jgi:hypothetical protein
MARHGQTLVPARYCQNEGEEPKQSSLLTFIVKAGARPPRLSASGAKEKVMPNWTHNYVTVTGPAEEIARFKQTCIVNGAFDFNTIIPMPDELRASVPPNGAITSEVFPDWYDWSCDNWGTKWNAHDFSCTDNRDGSFWFSFDTAWAPPVPIFRKLGDMFPALNFELRGNCVESDWAVEGSIKEGQLDIRKVPLKFTARDPKTGKTVTGTRIEISALFEEGSPVFADILCSEE